jgi:hypothetical protein
MAVTGYAGFRQGRRARSQIFCRVPVVQRGRGPFRGWGYLTRSAGNESDLEKSGPVARDWFKESRPRASQGGSARSAGGDRCPGQGTRSGHRQRHDVIGRRTRRRRCAWPAAHCRYAAPGSRRPVGVASCGPSLGTTALCYIPLNERASE